MSMKSLISETIEKGIKQIVCPIKLHESKVLTANFGPKMSAKSQMSARKCQ